MGRSHRRAFTLAAVIVIGAITMVAIAAASRAATPRAVVVASPVLADTTSAGASETAPADPTTATDTTTAVETTTRVRPEPTRTSTSTAEAPVASKPTTGPRSVDGTYFGVEHFALDTGRCAFLDHRIVGTFSVSDGTTWDFHQDYCGTLQGDLWSADGTFGLTAPDGAAITGTVTERNVKVPSPGVPYTLDITGGTQRFAGATGTCRLDNHLRQIQFGLQDDFGSFTCNIAL